MQVLVKTEGSFVAEEYLKIFQKAFYANMFRHAINVEKRT
jgi:hypothetical protein